MNKNILKKLKEWKQSPLKFVTECIGVTPTKQQIEALILLPKTKRLSIRSGHGCGKDALSAWTIFWFMTTRAYAKVACTAPTAHQLSDILWSELSKWLRQSKVADEFVVQKDKMFHKASPKEWWARAISPSVKASKEDQAETLAGLHADHLLILVDEASGVADPVFVPLEGAMTQEDNRVILIGNPTKNTGYFHNTQFHPVLSRKWTKLHWDSRDSEIVTQDMVDYFRDNYGEDSNIFRIRVMGEPPIDDESTFIPLSWALQCVGNNVEVDPDWPLHLSVDVARYGDDDSIILPRRGMKIGAWERFHGVHTLQLSHHILRTYKDMEANGVAVDAIGVGGGVVDWLQNDPRGLGYDKVFEFVASEASSDPKKYYRLRDELWNRVRTNCMKQKYSFPDQSIKLFGKDMNLGHMLADELASVKYNLDNSVIKVESKKDMKARGVKSPNIADALCISEYFSKDIAFGLWSPRQKTKKKRIIQPGVTQSLVNSQNWMSA